ncbi:hypothetical protein THIOKS12100070 [Thiocapsa sp. KS1]|nr:hypothetical protein THIOKS12100070 [Thiocapsa sp. KS1]
MAIHTRQPAPAKRPAARIATMSKRIRRGMRCTCVQLSAVGLRRRRSRRLDPLHERDEALALCGDQLRRTVHLREEIALRRLDDAREEHPIRLHIVARTHTDAAAVAAAQLDQGGGDRLGADLRHGRLDRRAVGALELRLPALDIGLQCSALTGSEEIDDELGPVSPCAAGRGHLVLELAHLALGRLGDPGIRDGRLIGQKSDGLIGRSGSRAGEQDGGDQQRAQDDGHRVVSLWCYGSRDSQDRGSNQVELGEGDLNGSTFGTIRPAVS